LLHFDDGAICGFSVTGDGLFADWTLVFNLAPLRDAEKAEVVHAAVHRARFKVRTLQRPVANLANLVQLLIFVLL